MDLATVIGKCGGLPIDSLPKEISSLTAIKTEFNLTDKEFYVLLVEVMKRKGKI